ncbi:MAG: DUF1552 domain-containing protein, partial [Verrucomicrobiota bacterium]|nr:DUF1552 domain-containing protein [Verrucomicrobiota bacterium]
AFNVFFGLGVPAPLQKEGYEGVLEPLKPLSNKLLIMRDVDQIRCDVSGTNAHFDGATGSFTAMPAGGEAKAGGPSIDQVVRYAHHPDGMPPGMVPTLIGGTYFRRSRVGRYLHSYNLDGTVAGIMQEKPRDLFDRVFGVINVEDGGDALKRRLKRSVLDSVVNQYKYFTGASSPLGSASKTRVAEHLDRIREYELRAFDLKARTENAPQLPPISQVRHGGQADPGGQGIDIGLKELTYEWRLMADLYALAIKMDRVRFGSITFLAAGERIRLTGDYYYDDRKIFEFNDAKQLNASGDQGCSHEWWHKFNEKNSNDQLRAHAHMKMREVAYFLKLLDQENESNGKTILENSMITISTESGDGRHNDAKRELSGVFHAISGANGRFKTGQIMDIAQEGIDVYNTMINAMGAKNRLGPVGREPRYVSSILA